MRNQRNRRKHLVYLSTIMLISLTACQDRELSVKPIFKPLVSGKKKDNSEFVISPIEFNIYKDDFIRKNPDLSLTDDELLQQYIDLELWDHEAHYKRLHNIQENMLRAKLLVKNFYVNQAQNSLYPANSIDSEEIIEEYNNLFNAVNRQQVKLQIISQPTRNDIEQTLDNLSMGADFKELMQLTLGDSESESESLIPEPDWVKVSTLPLNQIQAISTLEVGDYTQEPIESKNGWLIILLEDSRIPPIPLIKDVRNDIIAVIQKKHIAQHTLKLREAANIQINSNNLAKPQSQNLENRSDTDLGLSQDEQAIDVDENTTD